MQVTSKVFFESLRVDIKYYTKVFKNLGVKSPFQFDSKDLEIISNNLPKKRFKSVLVSNRAKSLLEASRCQN